MPSGPVISYGPRRVPDGSVMWATSSREERLPVADDAETRLSRLGRRVVHEETVAGGRDVVVAEHVPEEALEDRLRRRGLEPGRRRHRHREQPAVGRFEEELLPVAAPAWPCAALRGDLPLALPVHGLYEDLEAARLVRLVR